MSERPQLTPEQTAMLNEYFAKRQRFNEMFRRAWYSIAHERGWFYDRLMNECSHGTLALQLYMRGV